MDIQYIPRNMHTVFALLCFVVVVHWLIFPYPSGLLHWHCGKLTIAPVPAKQPWWIWINTSCEFIMNDCITTTKQSTTKPCAYFLGYTVYVCNWYGTVWFQHNGVQVLLKLSSRLHLMCFIKVPCTCVSQKRGPHSFFIWNNSLYLWILFYQNKDQSELRICYISLNWRMCA